MFNKGWYKKAKHIRSTNFNKRPDESDISLMVMHCISLPEGEYQNDNVERLFTNTLDCQEHESFESLKGVEVSAHFYIKRDGEIIQFVSVNDRAWHAGVSEYEGRESCNDFSVGVELQGTDSTFYDGCQYQSLNDLLEDLTNHYPSIKNITAHSDIAPLRKTDPGKFFDWKKVSFKPNGDLK